MSLASSTDCMTRPEEKASKLFFQSPEYSVTNCFDDFFHPDLHNDSDEDNIKPEIEESVDLLAFDACETSNEQDIRYAALSQAERSPTQPWRKGLWCLSQKPDTQRLVVEKTRKNNYAHPPDISPSHLIANNNFAVRHPRSLTQPLQTKNSSPTRLQHSHCPAPQEQQSPYREATMSPSLMYSHGFDDGRHQYVDSWQQDFSNISLQQHFKDDPYGIEDLSSYPLTNYSGMSFSQPRRRNQPNKAAGRLGPVRPATMHNIERDNERPDCYNDRANQELASIITANMAATSRNMFSESDSEDLTYKIINEDIPPMLDWTSQSPGSSNSHHSHQSHFPSISTSQDHNGLYSTMPVTDWWSPPTLLSTPSGRVSQEAFNDLAQPQPRRVTHNILTHHDLDGGLGIHYPSSDEIGVALPYHPPELQPSNTIQSQANYSRTPTGHTNALGSYPALPPPNHSFTEGSPFATPHRSHGRVSRSPSPPISPIHRTPRSHHPRSPSRREPSQHRRKSIHKSGPVRDTYTESSRNRSTSRPPRTPKTPKTPGDAFSLDFVNFTPRDAAKLLNDVAPSGSSKTRARREQEARDRRKKFSEAALDAVRQAGGDVEIVERAIFS